MYYIAGCYRLKAEEDKLDQQYNYLLKQESTKKVMILRILGELRYADSKIFTINEVIGTHHILV